jgi:GNAT superfamily N-acetyltransferase
MQKIMDHKGDGFSIGELYRYSTECGEMRCHRLTITECIAGELLLRVPRKEKSLFIEEVFVERKYRKMGLGTRLLNLAEETAKAMGLSTLELRPFSIDPTISENNLKEWYKHRGYRQTGDKMCKKLKNEKFIGIEETT